MLVTVRKRTLLFASFVTMLTFTGCSGEKKAAAPPKPGSLSHSWFTANESWKAGDYEKALQHIARLAVAQSEYRERARQWLLVTAGGIADGYRELADAYEEGAKVARQNNSLEYRRKIVETRNSANSTAMLYAETVHDFLNKEKDLKLKFDFSFPSGSASDPPELARVSKGMPLQTADHNAVRKAMLTRGVVRFAAALASPDGNVDQAKAQFANPPREVALAGVARNLIVLADVYCKRKLDMPKRGNALCKEAEDTLALLPRESKERKQLDTKLKDEMKRHVVKT